MFVVEAVKVLNKTISIRCDRKWLGCLDALCELSRRNRGEFLRDVVYAITLHDMAGASYRTELVNEDTRYLDHAGWDA